MSSQSDHSHPHHKGRAMVTKDYFQQSTSYYSDNSSTNNNASSDYSVGPAAWTQVGRFVPQNSFDPDINILSLSSTQRARLLEQREGTSRAFVETGVYTGGLPSGGPSANPRGYVRVEGERGMAVVHKRGERFIDGRPVDLGPAFGTGSEHDAECRRHTRNSAYQYTCFCRPRRDSELQEHVPGRSGNRGSFVTPRLYSSETQFVSADKRVSLRQAVDASYSNPGLPKHVSGNTENGGNLATLSSASKTQVIRNTLPKRIN
ncbi:hypothetical protein BDD12DRAFT_207174 [Trichophaea hybrida]|nr:hypothetical protein BDD12DRAFT_207174 [Trichophaea hybrida]